jgi:hypothetical protein
MLESSKCSAANPWTGCRQRQHSTLAGIPAACAYRAESFTCFADLHKTFTVIVKLLVEFAVLHCTAACSWLPSFFVQQVGISTRLSLWMLLTCMVKLLLGRAKVTANNGDCVKLCPGRMTLTAANDLQLYVTSIKCAVMCCADNPWARQYYYN